MFGIGKPEGPGIWSSFLGHTGCTCVSRGLSSRVDNSRGAQSSQSTWSQFHPIQEPTAFLTVGTILCLTTSRGGQLTPLRKSTFLWTSKMTSTALFIWSPDPTPVTALFYETKNNLPLSPHDTSFKYLKATTISAYSSFLTLCFFLLEMVTHGSNSLVESMDPGMLLANNTIPYLSCKLT